MSASSSQVDDPKDPRFTAAIDLIGRSGATSFELRYSDDQQPVVWMAIGSWPASLFDKGAKGERHEAAGALSPMKAVMRLLTSILDGVGTCSHCKRPTAVSDDFTRSMPLEDHVCWYVYDPEMQMFRRGCEGG